MNNLVLNSISENWVLFFPMKTCLIIGCVFAAIDPTTFEFTGTFLHPKTFNPCFSISFSKISIQ